jgi:hypothetical protein
MEKLRGPYFLITLAKKSYDDCRRRREQKTKTEQFDKAKGRKNRGMSKKKAEYIDSARETQRERR